MPLECYIILCARCYIIRLLIHIFVAGYVQQTGRAGRCGFSCSAMLYYNMEDIGRQTVTAEMREFCLTNSCRRNLIAEYFGYNLPTTNSISPSHECCNNCEKLCKCELCANRLVPSVIASNVLTTVNDGEVELSIVIQSALCDLFKLLDTSDELINCLTTSLATEIARKQMKYSDEAMLAADYSHLSMDTINYIYQTIDQCRQLKF